MPQHRALARRGAAALLLVAAFVAFVAAVPVANASPGAESLAQLQKRAAEVRNQVARLDEEASAAVEKYNQTRARLNACSARLIAARRELARSETKLEDAEIVLSSHLAGMYKSEQPGLLEVLLSLSDFSDLSTQLDYLQLIHDADASTVAELETLTTQAETLTTAVERERGQALEQEQALRERQAEIEAALAQRSALLDELDGRIKSLLERQAKREAAAARALAKQAGIDIESIDASPVQRALVAETMKYLGIPYVWGGASPSQGFDCSGLVMYVFAKFRVDVLHGATLQARGGTPVALSRLQPADLVFFGNASFYRHVGIYIGDGLFIEAPHTGDVVKISRLAGRGCAFACRYPIRRR